MKRIFTFIMSCILCLGVLPTTVAFAAEDTSAKNNNETQQTTDYLNYDFPEGAEILYQGKDGVVYTIDSNLSNDEQTLSASSRSVKHNQVWLDAKSWKSSSFSVDNPHPFAGNGTGRLRLESNDSSVMMNVVVSGGAFTFCTADVRVGTDVVFDYNYAGSSLTVHYYPKKVSNSHGMRLNCWLS